MSFSKWRFSSSRKASPSSSSNIDTSMSSSPTTGMSTPTSPISSSGGNSGRSSKSSSSLSSSPFSWFRSSSHRSNKKRKSTISRDDPAFARLHKPFTPQNLEHQRMFESFEWNFGSSDDDGDSYRRRRSSSLSPCATRDMTIGDYAMQDQSLQGSRDTLSSAFSCLSTRDAGREGYGQTTAAQY